MSKSAQRLAPSPDPWWNLRKDGPGWRDPTDGVTRGPTASHRWLDISERYSEQRIAPAVVGQKDAGNCDRCGWNLEPKHTHRSQPLVLWKVKSEKLPTLLGDRGVPNCNSQTVVARVERRITYYLDWNSQKSPGWSGTQAKLGPGPYCWYDLLKFNCYFWTAI